MDRKVALKAHLDRLNRGEARKVEAAKKAGKTYVAKKFKITDKSTEKPEHVVLRLGARTKTGYKTELGQGAKMLGNKHIAPRIATAKETAERRKSAAKLKKNLIRVPREYLGSKPYSKVKAEVRRHLSTSMRAAKSRGNTALAKAVSASVAQKRGAKKMVRSLNKPSQTFNKVDPATTRKMRKKIRRRKAKLASKQPPQKTSNSAYRDLLKRPKVGDWEGRLSKRIDIARAADVKRAKNQESPASKRKREQFSKIIFNNQRN